MNDAILTPSCKDWLGTERMQGKCSEMRAMQGNGGAMRAEFRELGLREAKWGGVRDGNEVNKERQPWLQLWKKNQGTTAAVSKPFACRVLRSATVSDGTRPP